MPVLTIDDPSYLPGVVQTDEHQMLVVAPVCIADAVESQPVIAARSDLGLQGVIRDRLRSTIAFFFEVQLLPCPRRGFWSRGPGMDAAGVR